MISREGGSLSALRETEEPLLIRAFLGEAVPMTPIWLMRQAGRYLPEYRRVRSQFDFLTVCKTPDLAVEVTLQPIRRFGFDGAILFSDILIPLEAMGLKVAFTPGPKVDPPVRTPGDVKVLRRPDPTQELSFVLETLRLLRRELPATVGLIGFAGGPFTMAAYMVEGEASKDFIQLKSLMYREPVTYHALMEKLSLVISDYLSAQIEAGAQAIQLFDTWAGVLSPRDYGEFVAPHVQRIIERVKTPGVPFILFGTGTAGLLELMAEAGPDVMGIDWRTSLKDARRRLGSDLPLQGNLEPAVLYAPFDIIREQAKQIMIDVGPNTAHVFNLGHGITPETPIDGVAELVRYVHEESPRLRERAATGEKS